MSARRPRRTPRGFTLIELIVVIVVLSILTATALPKFLDVGKSAKEAALKGVVGSAGSAMAINYASCVGVGHSTSDSTRCKKVDACGDLASLLQGGALPAGYSFTGINAIVMLGTGLPGSNGVEGTCTITQDDGGATATFLGISAGNG